MFKNTIIHSYCLLNYKFGFYYTIIFVHVKVKKQPSTNTVEDYRYYLIFRFYFVIIFYYVIIFVFFLYRIK